MGNSLRELLNTHKKKVGGKSKEEEEFAKLPLPLQRQALEYIRKWIKGVLE